MLKSELIIDPCKILKNKIVERLNDRRNVAVILAENDDEESWKATVIHCLLSNRIKIIVEDIGGAFDVGMQWDRTIDLSLRDIRYFLGTFASALGVKDEIETISQNIRITTIHNPGAKDHGEMYAGFFLDTIIK